MMLEVGWNKPHENDRIIGHISPTKTIVISDHPKYIACKPVVFFSYHFFVSLGDAMRNRDSEWPIDLIIDELSNGSRIFHTEKDFMMNDVFFMVNHGRIPVKPTTEAPCCASTPCCATSAMAEPNKSPAWTRERAIWKPMETPLRINNFMGNLWFIMVNLWLIMVNLWLTMVDDGKSMLDNGW